MLVDKCIAELSAALRPRCVYTAFPIRIQEDGVTLDGCSLLLPGKDIAAHLKNSRIAVLMAATLSDSADRLIRRFGAGDVAQGLVMDCCATTAIEQLCDDAETVIKREYPGSFFTTRFSPGYGDLPIEIQHAFLSALDAPRKIGLCATGSSILTPRKSVTAVIGVGNQTAYVSKTGCENCRLKENCSFRKRGEYCGLSKPAE